MAFVLVSADDTGVDRDVIGNQRVGNNPFLQAEILRRVAGIRKAKERGVKVGKRNKLSPEQVAELQNRREQGGAHQNANERI